MPPFFALMVKNNSKEYSKMREWRQLEAIQVLLWGHLAQKSSEAQAVMVLSFSHVTRYFYSYCCAPNHQILPGFYICNPLSSTAEPTPDMQSRGKRFV